MSMNTSTLIVGAGPVGLTLACELTRYRVPVRIVDKAPQRTDKSKAIVLWSRTLELLDRGDQGSEPFVEAGFKVDGVNIVAPDGRVVGHVKMDSVPSPYRTHFTPPRAGRRVAHSARRIRCCDHASRGPVINFGRAETDEQKMAARTPPSRLCRSSTDLCRASDLEQRLEDRWSLLVLVERAGKGRRPSKHHYSRGD
jgi:hypothetical protein